MFNLPPNIFNNRYFQGLANSGPKYSTVNPFRTVDKIGQYGGGLNSSTSQLYNYFRRGGKAADHGLPYGGDVQSLESFNQRNTPAMSAYNQRLGQLMQNQGMSRQDAIANQAHAIGLGADYNNDGSVGNDEWRQYRAGGQQGVPNPGTVPPANNVFNVPSFNPSIFNMQPMQQPQVSQPQQMDRSMAMPSGGPTPRQAIPMPNMNAGIFNMPQLNRR